MDTIKEKIELTADLPNDVAYGKSFFAYAIFVWINEWISRGMLESPSHLNQIFKDQSRIILETIQLMYVNSTDLKDRIEYVWVEKEQAYEHGLASYVPQ